MLPGFIGIILQILFGGSFLLAGITTCASIMFIDICLDKQKTMELVEMKEMFVQITETLASAIDAKDEYTHGHSIRVAQYSRLIAEMSGLPENEFHKIEEHPILGREILAHIRKLPYLTMGAKYHHERYDGLGYPERLKATDIPLYARIIAVADAYDAMTSIRSYRDPLPQDVVRNEIIKGSGRQFDPEFASVMVKIIDEDKFYKKKQNKNFNELYCVGSYENSYPGIPINPFEVSIKMKSEKLAKGPENLPLLVLFDAVDSRVHTGTESTIVVSDGSRFAFIGITGQECYIRDISENRSSELSPIDLIPRIAEEVKYFNKPDGDIPNVQVESWQSDPYSKNMLTVNKTEEFQNWNHWKKGNKKGRNINISIKREENNIIFHSECGGIILDNITNVSNGFKNLYVALTGDQVILEAIKITKSD